MYISRNDNRTVNTKRNGVYGLISRVVTLVVIFVVRTVIIYNLGIEYTGISSLFGAVIQVLNVSELGLSSAVLFSMYRPVANGDIDAVGDQLAILRLFYKVVGIVILFVGLGLVPFIDRIIKDEVPANVDIYVVYIVYIINTSLSYLFFGYKSVLLNVYQRNDILCKIKILTDIIRGVPQVLFIILFRNFYFYLLFETVSILFQNICILWIVNKNFGDIDFKKKIKKTNIIAISKPIKGAAIGRLSLVCRNSFDSIIISTLAGITATAIYSNYYYIFSSLFAFLGIIVTAMAGSVGNSLAKERIEKNERDHLKFDFYYMAVSSVFTITLFGFYQPFMCLWVGEAYCLPYFSMILFCLYFYTNSLSQIRAIYSEAAGMWWKFKFITIGEMVANLFLNFYLGYKWGINGILIATIITSVFSSFVCITLVVYKELFAAKPWRYYLNNLLYFIIAVVGCMFVYLLKNKLYSKNYLELLGKLLISGIGISLYILFVYYLIPYTRVHIIDAVHLLFRKKER